jgi:DNA-binding IclR family transcriptional regulator
VQDDPNPRRLDDDIRTFIRRYIANFEELEILRLLHEARGQFVTRDDVADRLVLRPSDVQDAFRALSRHGLLVLNDERGLACAAYRVEDPELDQHVSRALRAYEENRLEVVRVMNTIAREHGDSLVLQLFSNAFKMQRK